MMGRGSTELLKMTAKVLELRDDMRRLLGDDYGEQVRMGREIVRAHMTRHGIDNALEAALAVIPDGPPLEGRRFVQRILICAAVEMSEEAEERAEGRAS